MAVVGCAQTGSPSPLASSPLAEVPLISANDAPAASTRSNASLATAYAAILTPVPSNPELSVPSVRPLPNGTSTTDSSETPAPVLTQTPSAPEQKPLITPTPTATLTPAASPTPKPTNTPTPTAAPTAIPTQTADPACLPTAEPTLWLEVEGGETSIIVGEKISIRVCASGLVTGLSGFILTVSAQNGDVVEFTAVEYPKFGLQASTPLPDSTVTLKAIDLADRIPTNTESALLATISVLAKSSGSAPLSITIDALDDDDGFPVTLKTLQLTLDVTAN